MPGALHQAMALLDAMDFGDKVQEGYFLRGPGKPWSFHVRRLGGEWKVYTHSRLSDAIAASLRDLPEPEDDDGLDLI